MNTDTLNEAIKEADEFLIVAKTLMPDIKQNGLIFSSAKLRGKVRRQSMDLTRALAEMRKAN